jgi:ferredoxin/coenzyme F420-reducing hydrogenase delta subunit
VRALLRGAFGHLEALCDAVFGPCCNPLLLLGALAWFCFWIVTVSGIYLYIFFDSGVTEAYASVQHLTEAQWYAGGVMRSLHRYASDALVVVVVLHILREFAYGRFGGARCFTWITGVPLIWLLFAAGVSGYWVVWDKLAQYIAVTTTEWLDTLPLFGQAIARNFLNSEALSGRFFTLMMFIHIAVPLGMLFIMWVHIQRLAHPAVNPPRALAMGALGMFLVLSLVRPATSQGPADLDLVVAEIGLDWFYLGIYPLLDHYRGDLLWGVLGAATLGLLVIPWVLGRQPTAVAEVNLDNCNGCARCFADCPFGAIIMAARSDGAPFDREARVDAARCVGCGICVGACPTSTPFRRQTELRPGIDLDTLALGAVRESLLDICAALSERPGVLLYACQGAPKLDGLSGPGVAAIQLPCVAMLPPAFIDFALARGQADGVMIAGCREGGCYHRLGLNWTRARLARERDPYLRARVPAQRVRTCWAGHAGQSRLDREIAAFRAALRDADIKVNGDGVAN